MFFISPPPLTSRTHLARSLGGKGGRLSNSTSYRVCWRAVSEWYKLLERQCRLFASLPHPPSAHHATRVKHFLNQYSLKNKCSTLQSVRQNAQTPKGKHHELNLHKCKLKTRGSAFFQRDLATDSFHQLRLVCRYPLCLLAATDGTNARLVSSLAQDRPLRNSILQIHGTQLFSQPRPEALHWI